MWSNMDRITPNPYPIWNIFGYIIYLKSHNPNLIRNCFGLDINGSDWIHGYWVSKPISSHTLGPDREFWVMNENYVNCYSSIIVVNCNTTRLLVIMQMNCNSYSLLFPGHFAFSLIIWHRFPTKTLLSICVKNSKDEISFEGYNIAQVL